MTNIVYKNPFFCVKEVKSNYFIVEQNEGRGGSVVIIKCDDKFLCVMNDRVPTNEIEMEFCMGGRDEGESFLDCAIRECREETGFLIDESNMEYVGSFVTDTSVNVTRVSVFFCTAKEEDRVDILDTDEIKGIVYLTESELLEKMNAGVFRDGISLASYGLFKSKPN